MKGHPVQPLIIRSVFYQPETQPNPLSSVTPSGRCCWGRLDEASTAFCLICPCLLVDVVHLGLNGLLYTSITWYFFTIIKETQTQQNNLKHFYYLDTSCDELHNKEGK
jgi:hypothetical protein